MTDSELKDYAHSWITAYTEAGYALFPCTTNKIPTVKAWQHTKPGAYSFDQLFRFQAYGIVLRDIDLVIDVDPRNFNPKDDRPHNRLQQDTEQQYKTPHTFIVKTGGGGLHIYLAKNPILYINKRHPAYPGIEFLSKGCYVVGPGSMHKSLKRYLVGHGDIRNVHRQSETS